MAATKKTDPLSVFAKTSIPGSSGRSTWAASSAAAAANTSDPMNPQVPPPEGQPSPAGPMADRPQAQPGSAQRVNAASIPMGGKVPLADPGAASRAIGAKAAPKSFRVKQ